MRRVFVIILTFLALGAFTNVAVAWVLALYSPFWPMATYRDHALSIPQGRAREERIQWLIENDPFNEHETPASDGMLASGSGLDSAKAFIAEVRSTGFDALAMNIAPGASDRTDSVLRVQSGIPLKSFTGARWSSSVIESGTHTGAVRYVGGSAVRFGRRSVPWVTWEVILTERILPFRPIWPGFAVNTVYHAAVLWLFVAGPLALHRAIRRRRGVCETCDYSVGKSPVCTECGSPVRRQNGSPIQQENQELPRHQTAMKP